MGDPGHCDPGHSAYHWPGPGGLPLALRSSEALGPTLTAWQGQRGVFLVYMRALGETIHCGPVAETDSKPSLGFCGILGIQPMHHRICLPPGETQHFELRSHAVWARSKAHTIRCMRYPTRLGEGQMTESRQFPIDRQAEGLQVEAVVRLLPCLPTMLNLLATLGGELQQLIAVSSKLNERLKRLVGLPAFRDCRSQLFPHVLLPSDLRTWHGMESKTPHSDRFRLGRFFYQAE